MARSPYIRTLEGMREYIDFLSQLRTTVVITGTIADARIRLARRPATAIATSGDTRRTDERWEWLITAPGTSSSG